MNSLTLINETYSNGYRSEALDVFSLISIVAAIFVIISKNPIVSVLFLIGLFVSIASYLIIIGLSFIGLSYILVYVGAVSILFLFILMLINIRISELLSNTSNTMPLAFIVALFLNYPLYLIIPETFSIYNTYFTAPYVSAYSYDSTKHDIKVSFVSTKLWDGVLSDMTHISAIGNIMYTSYSMWLIISSIILLLAMVGAIVITIKQRY